MTKNDLMNPALQSWRELDETLGQYAQVQNELDHIKAKKNAQIQKLKAELEEATADLEAREKQLKQLMDIYVNSRLEEIRAGGKKSMALTNGTVKTKANTVYTYPEDAYLVELLKKYKLTDCIKTDEKPLKSVLKLKLEGDESLLAKLGVDRDEETVVDYKVA